MAKITAKQAEAVVKASPYLKLELALPDGKWIARYSKGKYTSLCILYRDYDGDVYYRMLYGIKPLRQEIEDVTAEIDREEEKHRNFYSQMEKNLTRTS